MRKERPISTTFAIAILFVFTLLIFHGVIFRQGVVFGQDTIVQGYPLAWFEANALRSGTTPAWYPYMMSGLPMSTAMPFYPTDFLLLLLPVTRAITWRLILHAFGGTVFMYLLMRRFGRSSSASVIAGMAFGFSAFFISKIYAGHGAALWSGIWLPLTMLFLDRTIETKRAKYAVLTGAVLGIQILGQHPQYVFYSVLAMALYAAWMILPEIIRDRRLQPVLNYVALAGLVGLFALMISAPHLLAFAENTKLSNRGGGTGYEFAASLSMKPVQLLTAAVPSFWGSPARSNSVNGALYWDGALYVGVIPLLLALLAFVRMKDRRAGYFKWLAVASILIALGDYTPLYRIIYHIPGFDMIRAPSKTTFLYAFAIAGLAGYGMDVLLAAAPRLHPRRRAVSMELITNQLPETAKGIQKFFVRWLLAMLILLALWIAARGSILDIARAVIANRPDAAETLLKLKGLYALQTASIAFSALMAGAVALVVFVLMQRFITTRTAAAAIVAVTIFDLVMFADPLLFTVDAKKEYLKPDRHAIEFVKSDPEQFRILPLDTETFLYAQGSFDGLESVNGYFPISLARYAAFVGAIENAPPYVSVSADISNHASPLVDMLNVKYVLSSSPIEGSDLDKLYSGRTHLYLNPNYLPRAYTVHDLELEPTPERALRAVRRASFDPRTTVVLENPEHVRRVSGNSLHDGVKIVSYTLKEIKIRVGMSSPGYLVMSDVYHPSWRAWVNGKRVDIMPANYLFKAIYLPKGHHDVRVAFVSGRYKFGAVLSVVSIMFIIGMLLVTARLDGLKRESEI